MRQGEQGKYAGQLLMICAQWRKTADFLMTGRKLMICLKRGYQHKRVQSLFSGVIWQQMH